MPRVKKQPDSFSFTELGEAAELRKRSVQHLSDASPSLLPDGNGVNVLKRTAAIGAFVSAGVPLLAAGQIVTAMLDEFMTEDGEVESGLPQLVVGVPKELRSQLPEEPNDYWYHQILLQCGDIYSPGQALPSDAIIEICDRRYIFIGSRARLRMLGNTSQDGLGLIGLISGWERGGAQLTITPPSGREDLTAIQANSVGILTVNVSLSIRNGLDRVAEARQKKPAFNKRRSAL